MTALDIYPCEPDERASVHKTLCRYDAWRLLNAVKWDAKTLCMLFRGPLPSQPIEVGKILLVIID